MNTSWLKNYIDFRIRSPVGHVLPQYLIYSLSHPQSDATERVIFHLAPDDTESEYWRDRLAILSPAERSAIREYLRYMQVQLAGQRYDEYFERALSVMGGSNTPR